MKLIILDRDGVINRDRANYVTSPQEWQALDGSLDAIARLNRADYQVVVITNQAGVAKGLYSINTLNRIHQKMLDELHLVGGEISAIFFCPHQHEDACRCRKPAPGLFDAVAKRLKCSLQEVYAVGDALRDLQAAQRAGAKPILVLTGKGKATCAALQHAEDTAALRDVPVYADLAAFVGQLVGESA